MSLLDQSGVTGGGLDPYNVHALFVNMDNMCMERFENYNCLVSSLNVSSGWIETFLAACLAGLCSGFR